MFTKTVELYEFGKFRLDTEQRVLFQNDVPVSITPKVFGLLIVLIENRGRVVEKDFLMSRLWADCFVEESNLTFTIGQLRKILGDDSKNPLFIETVPRRGYRFIHEVEATFVEEKFVQEQFVKEKAAIAETSALANFQPEPIKIERQARRIFAPPAVLGLFLLGTIATGSWLARNRAITGQAAAPILTQPFSAERLSSKQSVWLRRLESADNVQIVAPSDNLYFGYAFANDGQTLYFVRRSPADGVIASVYRMPVFGGVAEKIVERVEGKISLSPDDEQISFVRCEKRTEDFCALYTVDRDGRDERKIFVQKSPFQITDNQFSPDGQTIAFAGGQSFDGGCDFRLKLIDVISGELRDASAKTFFIIKSLRWLPGGTDVLLTAKESLNDKYHIWRVSLSTGETNKLTEDAVEYATISLSKTGDKLLATQSSDNFRLYLAANGETIDLTNAREATFAPDNKIYYAADNDIWTINPDGTDQRQLTNRRASDFSPIVAPDNQTIYFASNRSGANQVWRMNRDGTNQIQITKKTGGYPRFVSPDGKWIFYESGFHQTIWKIFADGGEETEVFKTKMFSPAFSPDGSYVAYLFRDKTQKIGVMRIADEQIVKIIAGDNQKSNFVRLAWSNDSRTLNFAVERDSRNELWQQSLDESEARFAGDLGDKQIKSIAVSSAANAVAYTRGEWLSDAVLIKGFK